MREFASLAHGQRLGFGQLIGWRKARSRAAARFGTVPVVIVDHGAIAVIHGRAVDPAARVLTVALSGCHRR